MASKWDRAQRIRVTSEFIHATRYSDMPSTELCQTYFPNKHCCPPQYEFFARYVVLCTYLRAIQLQSPFIQQLQFTAT
jgi:hypothetical protein